MVTLSYSAIIDWFRLNLHLILASMKIGKEESGVLPNLHSYSSSLILAPRVIYSIQTLPPCCIEYVTRLFAYEEIQTTI